MCQPRRATIAGGAPREEEVEKESNLGTLKQDLKAHSTINSILSSES